MREVLVGNLCMDINKTETSEYIGPGGPAFYMGRTFENFGVSATIVSPRGVDFPTKYLPHTIFVPSEPFFGNTLVFRNTYHGGQRKQAVENYAASLTFDWQESLKLVAPDTDIVAVAPILNNIDQIRAIKKIFPASLFVLLPQGFYRRIDERGHILHALWDEEGEVVGLFDFISLSEEDLKDADVRAAAWSREGPLVAVTRAQNGVTLYQGGQRRDHPAFSVPEIVDPTGAGDIFAAAFSYLYRKTNQVKVAVEFAQATAALSLRQTSDQLQYSEEDVIKFAASQGRPLAL